MLWFFCHIEVESIQTAARHSISIMIFRGSNEKRQFWAIYTERTFCVQEMKIKPVLYMYLRCQQYQAKSSQSAVCFDQANLKNVKTFSFVVYIIVTVQVALCKYSNATTYVTSEIKRNIANHFHNPHHSCEEKQP